MLKLADHGTVTATEKETTFDNWNLAPLPAKHRPADPGRACLPGSRTLRLLGKVPTGT